MITKCSLPKDLTNKEIGQWEPIKFSSSLGHISSTERVTAYEPLESSYSRHQSVF